MDQADAEHTRRAVWVDADAYMAETERLAAQADAEAALRRQLAGLQQAARAAESDAEPLTASAPDFVRLGLTYRQVDYWTTRGWLRPVGGANPGSGNERRWPRTELRVAELMRRMAGVGIEPWAAAGPARELAGLPDSQWQPVRLGKDVWIDVR